ncbi:long-chain fatty acid--CoA ligase [Pueribacillus theae]|uniref:Long-chain fatty acid--CoA ligase n=1 Tax=Pueribacillus theae TaxID=2171751 RepID=A0A2U1K0M7_9BACI|nr:long-chain fatty acid--CoA ligase [Pueribacillus theae]PWA10744.1 long-chain fatty acid--CoA ligase [Pueribacillus theae]
MIERVWHKNYPPTVRKYLNEPDRTLTEIIKENAEKFSDRVAIKSFDMTINYKQLVEKINKLSNSLEDLGVSKGDRVALMMQNSVEYIISYCAILNIGATAVPINPLYKGRDISYRINDSGTNILIIEKELVERFKKIQNETKIHKMIVTKIKKRIENFTKSIELNESITIYSFDTLLSIYSSNFMESSIKMDDVALLAYTGGTTGVSKGAMLTHKNMMASVWQMFEWYVGLEKGKEVVPLILPTSHITGLNCVMNLALATAQTIIVKPRFSATDILETVEKERVTMLCMVPTLYVELINHPDLPKYNLKSLKICTSGGAPTPIEVQKQFERITGSNLTEAFGLTECSPGVCLTPVGGEKRDRSIGLPLPDTDCKIVDLETGTKEVPVGEIGELIVQGPQVMKGYWNKPEENKITLRNGWLYTGDVVYRDEDGFFYVADRKKDVIVTGGYNVYPREVEEILYEIPGIKESAVIGIPHDYYGETVKAVVALKEDHNITEDDVINFCKQRLTTYKCPTVIEIRDELPKSPAGKILRRELRLQKTN